MTNQNEIRIEPTKENRIMVRRAQQALKVAEAESDNSGLEINNLFHSLLGGLLKGALRPDVMEEIAEIGGACVHSDPKFQSAVCRANDVYGILIRGESASTLAAEKRWEAIKAKHS